MSETERLIELVRASPILYDTSHVDFKNTIKKEEAWFKIIESFEAKDDVDWKKKWKNLKDSYVKYLKSEDEKATKRNPSLKRYQYWSWASKMEFIRPFCKFGKLTKREPNTTTDKDKQWFDLPDGICSEEEDLTDEILYDPTEEQVDIKTIVYENQEINQLEIQHVNVDNFNNDSKENNIHSKATKRKSNANLKPNHDDIELILMAYAKTIKKFSPKRQTMVKFKFSQIIMEAELAQLEEDEKDGPSAGKRFKDPSSSSYLSSDP
ncbi:uncharacterized protein LOC129909922 [Episyrphus balteatus]|uniref:uncharacterized protein LOC129909922 n=1 Tax=Episyrphus balteatus TaxID=286459 RepID=UPI0024854DA3|nr:uncharacterized protein LOC129909922 [Episyrphus balteatus]